VTPEEHVPQDCGEGYCGNCQRCQRLEADYYARMDEERQAAAYEDERAGFEADPSSYLADPTAQPDERDVPF